MSVPKASTSSDQATDLDGAESDFVASMDAMQEYMQLQTKLQEQLKQGLLSLARAKYSMGPIGQAQYDMEMEASVRVAVSSEEAPGAAPATSSSGRYSFTIQRAPATTRRPPSGVGPAAATADAAGDAATAAAAAGPGGGGGAGPSARGEAVAAPPGRPAGGEAEVEVEVDFSDDDGEEEGEEEGLREANEFLRRMRMEAEEAGGTGGGGNGGGGEGGMAAGGGGGGAAGGHQKQGQRRRRRQGGGGDPLHWFGVLVPPALKEAQGQFAAALETCLRLANTSQRVGCGRRLEAR